GQVREGLHDHLGLAGRDEDVEVSNGLLPSAYGSAEAPLLDPFEVLERAGNLVSERQGASERHALLALLDEADRLQDVRLGLRLNPWVPLQLSGFGEFLERRGVLHASLVVGELGAFRA